MAVSGRHIAVIALLILTSFRLFCGSPCTDNSHHCKQDSQRCVEKNNTDGYTCECLQVDQEVDNQGNCTVCRESFHYGSNCELHCHCLHNNSKSCDHVNGTCICKEGWTGVTCDTDVNECQTNQGVCSSTFTKCVNVPGSYKCVCADNVTQNPVTGECDVCSEPFHYGPNCVLHCHCLNNSSKSCDPGNGTCICKEGWTGVKCDTDEDECQTNQGVCSGTFTKCVNVLGSYKCVCADNVTPNLITGECDGLDYKWYIVFGVLGMLVIIIVVMAIIICKRRGSRPLNSRVLAGRDISKSLSISSEVYAEIEQVTETANKLSSSVYLRPLPEANRPSAQRK